MEHNTSDLPPNTPRVSDPERQAQSWAMFCHLSALLGFVWFPLSAVTVIPFGHLVGPLVIWLLKRKDYPLVDDQGKEALNFQISMTIYGILASILVLILVGFVVLIGLAIADVILVIVAAVKASEGVPYRYPLTIRFIK